jgi:hypothetical protein
MRNDRDLGNDERDRKTERETEKAQE